MRDSFGFHMLPIVQDNMNYVPGARSVISLSSNGYYGYQPPAVEKRKEESPPMEVQYDTPHPLPNRKRAWEYANDFWEFKRRRQHECQQLSAPRKPTHNIPDVSRCLMGHYV